MSKVSFNPAADETIINGEMSRAHVAHFRRTAAQNCAADTDGILDGTELTASAQTVTTFLAQPSCAKNITVVGGAAAMAGTVKVKGKDYYGESIEESYTLSGTTPQVGSNAFSEITSIELPAKTNAGDTVDVGWGTKIGMPIAMAQNTIVKSLRDGNTNDSGTLAAANAVCSTTYTAGTAAKSLDIWFLVN